MSENSVVVKQQDQIEIYANDDGGISIKQTSGYGEEQFIWFQMEHAEHIGQAILDLYAKEWGK